MALKTVTLIYTSIAVTLAPAALAARMIAGAPRDTTTETLLGLQFQTDLPTTAGINGIRTIAYHWDPAGQIFDTAGMIAVLSNFYTASIARGTRSPCKATVPTIV